MVCIHTSGHKGKCCFVQIAQTTSTTITRKGSVLWSWGKNYCRRLFSQPDIFHAHVLYWHWRPPMESMQTLPWLIPILNSSLYLEVAYFTIISIQWPQFKVQYFFSLDCLQDFVGAGAISHQANNNRQNKIKLSWQKPSKQPADLLSSLSAGKDLMAHNECEWYGTTKSLRSGAQLMLSKQ